MKIIPHEKYKDMYRLQWPDGFVSTNSVNPKPWEPGGHYGFYNKTRALELCKRQGIEDYAPGVTYADPSSRID